ncbi:MAG: hypothetical protein FK733_00180 [Asgard group archaeon]|nr:hypothetical protein [Asgard group archaeon]
MSKDKSNKNKTNSNKKTEKTKVEIKSERKQRRAEKKQVKKAATKEKQKGIWTWTKYFVMKWRFRLDQARAIFGLVTFAILLANSYGDDLPWFKDDWRREILLAVIVFFIFALGGYLYDRSFRLWTETQKVSVERNPYTYVPNPKERWQSRAFWSYNLTVLSQIAEKLDIKIENEEFMRLFISHYYSLTPSHDNIEQESVKLSKVADRFQEAFLSRGSISSFEDLLDRVEKEMEKEEKEKSKKTDKKA